jgi:hypothetical protein
MGDLRCGPAGQRCFHRFQCHTDAIATAVMDRVGQQICHHLFYTVDDPIAAQVAARLILDDRFRLKTRGIIKLLKCCVQSSRMIAPLA